MKTKIFLTATLLFSFSCVFSQITNPCAKFSYSLSRELQVPADAKTATTLLDDSFCEKETLPKIHFKPETYDWAKDAQRLADYRYYQYDGHPQDANGRDLMLEVITVGVINQLLNRPTPY